jgi:hypothetical protein
MTASRTRDETYALIARRDRLEGECPVPALVPADLHMVVCRAPCSITCAPCWTALLSRESNPLHCPPCTSK